MGPENSFEHIPPSEYRELEQPDTSPMTPQEINESHIREDSLFEGRRQAAELTGDGRTEEDKNMEKLDVLILPCFKDETRLMPSGVMQSLTQMGYNFTQKEVIESLMRLSHSGKLIESPPNSFTWKLNK